MIDDQFNSEEDYDGFTIGMQIEDIFLLYDCVKRRLESWEGYPARPREEQRHLLELRDNLYRCILDHKFNDM